MTVTFHSYTYSFAYYGQDELAHVAWLHPRTVTHLSTNPT